MLLDFEREGEQSNIRKILVDFLFKHRNTPRSETGISPAELIFKFKVLTDLRLLRIGRSVETEIQEGISLAKFKINELVWVLKTDSSKNAKGNWESGKITKIVSRNLCRKSPHGSFSIYFDWCYCVLQFSSILCKIFI